MWCVCEHDSRACVLVEPTVVLVPADVAVCPVCQMIIDCLQLGVIASRRIRVFQYVGRSCLAAELRLQGCWLNPESDQLQAGAAVCRLKSCMHICLCNGLGPRSLLLVSGFAHSAHHVAGRGATPRWICAMYRQQLHSKLFQLVDTM